MSDQPPVVDADASTPAPARARPTARSAHGDVSRTWELELLISGAVLFGLFQLPPVLDDAFARLDPHSTRQIGIVVFLVYYYSKAIVYTLIASFLLHLIARAYWVGLIGLDSVFPHGVRWEQIRYGPITKQVYQESVPTLPTAIKRVDNFCSIVFSFAFVIVVLYGVSIIAVSLFTTLAHLVSRVLFDGRHAGVTFQILFFTVFGIPLLVSLLDKLLGDRLDVRRGAGRALFRLQNRFFRLQALAVYGPILVTLFSNVPKKVMYPLFYLAFFGVIGAVFLDVMVRNELLTVSSYRFLPEEAGIHGVDYRHYENQRPAGEVFARIPSIQADIIRDPFVKLFIPYVPRRHNAALAARCPQLRPLQDAGFQLGRSEGWAEEAAMTAVLDCLAGLHQVTLNGNPLPDPQLQFYTHPQTGLRGVILYIPAEDLPRGRNLLTVQQAPRARESDGAGSSEARPLDPYIIPFWL